MAGVSGNLGTKPFFFKGGPAGCLLIHGFTGTPPEMEYLGRALAARGMTVSGVQLAGHGTVPEDMILTGRADWYKSAERALLELREKCSEVFVSGLSMGGALTLLLCARHGDKILAAAPLAAAAVIKDKRLALAGFASNFIKYLPAPTDCDLTDVEANNTMKSYDRMPLRCAAELRALTQEVQRELPNVKTPLLIMHGLKDRTLWPGNAQFIYDHVSSEDKTIHHLDNSGHGVTVDVQKDTVAEMVFGHFRRYSKVLK